jgi:hypothetical protein
MTGQIALVSGFWGQNVGNAFFNLGGRWLLEEAFGTSTVGFLQDQPGYRTFHRKKSGNPSNAYDLLGDADIDLLVLQGPLLTTTALDLWAPTLRRLRARGVSWLYLGAALFKYTAKERQTALAFLRQFPPIAVSTRDAATAEAIAELHIPVHSGIDSAFALPNVVRPVPMISSDRFRIALSFDRYPEPTFYPDPSGFAVGDGHYSYRQPPLQQWLSKTGKWQAYIGAWLDRSPRSAPFAGSELIRLAHRTNPFVGWKVYQRPDTVASDEPWTYLTVYSSVDLVLSDRVHACVAALAYGNPAMLFSPSPRAALFEAVGASDITLRPVTVPWERIESRLEEVVNFLRRAVER